MRPHDDTDAMACRACGLILNRYLDLTTGELHYTHPLAADAQPIDHRPDPAPVDEVDARHRCDFCSDERIIYVYETEPVQTVVYSDDGEQYVQDYGTHWSACIECAQLLQRRDLRRLHDRVAHRGPHLDPRAHDAVGLMLRAVLEHLRPGRTLATVGHWQPIPPAAAILPKVRDRLTHLLRSNLSLPLGLDPPTVRGQLADSLDAAHLYWIDDQFTDLTAHAADTLPTTTITTDLPPTPHGLLAWARPLGPRATTVAASWTSSPADVRILTYRSVGAGLTPVALQQLREQVGWLTPQHHIEAASGDLLDTSSPARVLVTAWLLIAQRLAEQTPADVDRTIRKAYQRGGRPAPDVRLVQLRGATASRDSQTRPAAGRADQGRDREFRWWVRGHWRNQAYGPGRALRKAIFIDPQIRGPHDRPIKASTTVRVLASPTTRQQRTPGSDG